jgi:hypothetical protein
MVASEATRGDEMVKPTRTNPDSLTTSDEKVGDFIVVSKDGGFTIGIKTWYGYTIYQERPIITTYTIAQQWVDALNAKKANHEQ